MEGLSKEHGAMMIDLLRSIDKKLNQGSSSDGVMEALKMLSGQIARKQEVVIGGTPNRNIIPYAADIHDNTVTVATSGVAVQLSSFGSVPVMCNQVTITAHESNTGTVVVGSSTVVAALSGRRGTPIYPTQSLTLNIADLSRVWVDSTVSGDKVTISYLV